MTNHKSENSLVHRARQRVALNRRQFNASLAATAATLSFLPAGRVHAATEMNYIGWQGYDDPLVADNYLDKNGITLERTYIDSNPQLITKIQAGGKGHIDVATPYFGHVNLMLDADLLEPLDMDQIPNFKDMMPFLYMSYNA